jgi:Flp pilus assembly protein TadD
MNATVLNNLGYSLMMSKQYPAAEKVFREGLNYEPGFFRIRNNLAISLAWQSRFEEAIDILVKVVKYEVAYNNIGYIAMLNNQYLVAKNYFKKAMFISPSYYVRAARNLEKVENLMRQDIKPQLENPIVR